MLKALMKKQLLELNSFYFQSRKTGKRRTRMGTLAFAALYLVLFIYLGVIFFFMANGLIEPVQAIGEDWLFFCVMGLLAVLLGTFGSVFTTYSGLYQAKDNDALLAMPIPPTKIVLVRIAGVTITGLMYEATVLIPTIIARFMHGMTPAVIGGTLLMCVDIAVLVTVLTCILGWLVALAAVRLKGKSWVTALISLVFLGAYFYVCGNSYEFIEGMIANLGSLSAKLKGWLYPFYVMGCAAEGAVPAMIGFTAACLIGLAAVWLVLSRTFVRIASRTQEGVSRRRTPVNYARVRSGSVGLALLGKEWRRFTSSSTYMLNAGLSSVLLPAMAIIAVWKRELLATELLPVFKLIPGVNGLVVLVLAAMLCLLGGMNAVTAPSVSLEGKSIWAVQTLPVPAWRVLLAKIELQLLITVPAMVLAGALLAWVLGLGVWETVLALGCACLFVLLNAECGLAVNLKLPNLTWTNEVIPVKQGMSVMITLFGSFAVIGALGGLYYLLYELVQPVLFLGLAAAVFAVASALMALWLKKRGAAIFSRL